MKILLTGANGFLGHYLSGELLRADHELVATGHGECRLPFSGNPMFVYEEMDFTDPFAAHDLFEKYRPPVVIHAGGMTSPDECEMNQWKAYVTNVEGTVTLLTNAAECGSHFIFVSTDFVFDGIRGMYSEEDIPSPINYYGKTKWEAESAVMDYEHDWAIARTVLVYGKPVSAKLNLLSVVKEKLSKGESYGVVNDQFRTPTYVGDLAKGITSMVAKRATGIFHLSGKDVLTPYEMAMHTADFLQLDNSLLKKVTATNFSQPARRPLRTGFVIDKAKTQLGFDPVSFSEGLALTFQ